MNFNEVLAEDMKTHSIPLAERNSTQLALNSAALILLECRRRLLCVREGTLELLDNCGGISNYEIAELASELDILNEDDPKAEKIFEAFEDSNQAAEAQIFKGLGWF